MNCNAKQHRQIPSTMAQNLNAFCFVCNQRPNLFYRALDEHKAPSTQTPLNKLINTFLVNIQSNRCIDDATDIICKICIGRIHHYDRLFNELQAVCLEITNLLRRDDDSGVQPAAFTGKVDSVEPWIVEEMFSACRTAIGMPVLPTKSNDIVTADNMEDDFEWKLEEENKKQTSKPGLHKCIPGCHRVYKHRSKLLVMKLKREYLNRFLRANSLISWPITIFNVVA